MTRDFAIHHAVTLSLLLVIVCVNVSVINRSFKPKGNGDFPSDPGESQKYMASESAHEIYGVKIHNKPSDSKLAEHGVASWPKWECGPSKFQWTFTATETMYILQGKVKVYAEGHEESFEIGAGDMVVFPKGMKVTWDVIEAVSKHYSLEK